MDMYSKRYLEFGEQFYDLLKHDLKNFQSTTLMALDLYKIKKDEKYLDQIEKVSDIVLDYIETIKKVEPYIYSGSSPGFYSQHACINKAMEKYPDMKIEFSGDDACIFADAALPKLFDLLIQVALENDKKHNILLTTSKLQEDGLNKYRVRVDIHNCSAPKNTFEAILNDNKSSIIEDKLVIVLYITKMVFYRYSANLELAESTDDKVTFIITFLSADNPEFHSLTRMFE